MVSAAKPKIANYAFTTLEPNLGIVEVRDHKSFVMADIPGIIEGRTRGRGLGTRFLRHIERNSVLLFMIPADSDDLKRDYAVLLGELREYNPELLDKQRLLAITKCDMLDDELIEEMKSHLPGRRPVGVYLVGFGAEYPPLERYAVGSAATVRNPPRGWRCGRVFSVEIVDYPIYGACACGTGLRKCMPPCGR